MSLIRNKFTEVKGFDGYYANISGEILGKRGNILKPTKANGGYYVVTLHKDGKQCRKYVHRLIAETFIENPDNKEQINHKDGNKENNCIYNLEWCTRSENQLHRYRVLGSKPSIHGEKAVKCCDLNGGVIQLFKSISEASRITGVDVSQISGCCLGRDSYYTAGGYKWCFYLN